MEFPRSSGLLLHPTSLPGPYGIGDLGIQAREFVDFLSASGQHLWQVLPLGPPSYGNSPYQCFSAFAGNTQLVSPEGLVEDGLLSRSDLEGAPRFGEERVDYEAASKFKNRLLGKAFENFKERGPQARSEFDQFRRFAAYWLDDYSTFRALQEDHNYEPWNTWEPELAGRGPEALARARSEMADRIEAQRFYQYIFFKQWLTLKAYANRRGVKLVGDMPIFVAYDSADVWTHPELFKLDEDKRPRVVAGVPPDYFSRTGQLWGNPIYEWERMGVTGFAWWAERMRAALHTVDLVRVDHFRGFAAAWEVPAKDETAEHGSWVKVPGKELFTALRDALGHLPVIAEDLGTITPDVLTLRDELGLPGMRVLQFAFGGDPNDTHLPHNYARASVVYTGTHDNDTTVGWFNRRPEKDSPSSAARIERERNLALKYLGSDGEEIHWDFIRAAFASVSDLAIIPLQDVLGLDSSARMNLPATPDGNWAWRFKPGALTREIGERLKEMTEIYGRRVYQ
ncbi:MAG TPA: 4-alpha-glucanotransferase [Blastocatellia bacterium]|jgi:4-alpha-glucanotransferase|nr:4-alpha-glucanotransferase [Blastocatellia bacterium]